MHKKMGAFLVVLSLASCHNNPDQIIMKSLNGSWPKEEVQQFDFSISDSQNPKNIIFVLRNNNDYPYSNIRLIVKTFQSGTKKAEVDTLNYLVAQPNGAWLGKGFGETKEILFQYKMNYQFPANGKYSVAAIQAMRQDTLVGIEDIGVKIETVKP